MCIRDRYTPVSPSVPEMEGIHATGGILFWGCAFGGVYIPCIYSHAWCTYCRRFRSLSLCPLSVERYYFPLFVDFTQALKASFCFRLQQFTLRSTCKCVYVCVYMLSQSRNVRTMKGLEWNLVLSYACTHLCRRVCLKWRVSFLDWFNWFEHTLLSEGYMGVCIMYTHA